jgi:Abnormal spindle-like microcephaly-assoc'd, ASPM-SPD-2-Hydin
MLSKTERMSSPICRLKALAVTVAFAALALMAGCAGVSNSSSSPGSGSGSGSSGGAGSSGNAQLGVSPATLAIGNVMDGSSGSAPGTLSASGASVTVTAANTNNSAFSISGLSLPVTIDAGKTVPFTVTFSPSASGTASGTLTFSSNAQATTTAEALTGTGTAAPTHSVNLSWNASSSPSISGYNVYRAIYASSCGSFSKINSALNTSTLYTDSAVTDGTSYCYATTAVNTSSEESGYSNIASPVQIPAQ